jgi:general stress protein YciG
MVAKEDRGFASMDRTKQREIASKGGKAAHQKGTAHEWTSEEAREAGRKGGMASHRRKQEQQQQPQSSQAVAHDMSSGEMGDIEPRRESGLENPSDTGERGDVRDEPKY